MAYLIFCNDSKLICKNLILFVETPFIQTSFHDFSRKVTLTDNAIDSCMNFWTLRWLFKVFSMFFALLFEMPEKYMVYLCTYGRVSSFRRAMVKIKICVEMWRKWRGNSKMMPILPMHNHSPEIRGLCSTKCSSETLQNLLYFMYKKTTLVFLYIKYSKFWSVSLEHFVKRKPLIYEECQMEEMIVLA